MSTWCARSLNHLVICTLPLFPSLLYKLYTRFFLCLQAARDNRIDVVDAHINHFLHRNEVGKLNNWDMNGFAPIHYAAKFNRYGIMKKLVGAGEDIYEDDDENNSRSGTVLTLFPACKYIIGLEYRD